MTHIHPKDVKKAPDKPFESENVTAEEAGRVLERQRSDKFHGGVSTERDATDNPVRDSKPFKNLKG